MLKCLFKLLAALPLPVLHWLGDVLGYVLYVASPPDRRRIRQNLAFAQLPNHRRAVLQVCQETVKSGLELAIACFRQPAQISALFTQVYGWEHVEQAQQQGAGLLLITPHLGSYDLAGRYISERLPCPLTAMYKPPKIQAFDQIMQQGRQRGKGRTAPTNLQGVKQVIKALRQGEATIVLPDHVPNPHEGGDGVWVDFFGQPAYTMTLAGKLAQVNNVVTLFFVGERLPNGQGFALHIAPVQGEFTGDKAHDARVINQNIEHWIRHFPLQYLFAYNRYKHP
ncbi:lysophospholipid acyltransferase family protein [Kingella kingae]|uniref:Lipid A biosynthesis lauroyl acyltransferase n=3 Tax=Kingella kingae TaxID=504 RepID=F5S779_KINKI|nr:lysophospholipid acyltransferase family protein [Kingella kingae]EGK09398.1 lipid A biosynthesis lauroyl acyltransferase [Kingella kingae ATCC 23330]MDK4534227.1 lysophospholipid acyltransferase family protein [Kingella kingae]MDK4538255.1 lysophospholipid acyltransferase family protein [Kingella kingae]MDK4540665.1 lysophospholipid acyltransferase family protein [Kingella kingae]MDK4545969.1 lysophospholipid acyltransferase family protein [Kingella kingae]